MAIGITQIERDRKKFLKSARPQIREVLTAGNSLIRDLDRVVARKRAMPEDSDLNRFLGFCNKIASELGDVVGLFSTGYLQ